MYATVKLTPASRKRNDELLPLVVAGNPAAIEEMTVSNLTLAAHKIKCYIKTHPGTSHLSDEMEAEAALHLVKAVRGLVGSKSSKPNVTGYLSLAVRSAIRTVLAARGISMSATTVGRRLKKDQTIPKSKPLDRDRSHEPNKLADVKQRIVAACRDDRDFQICDLRRQGFDDVEIAARLGMTQSQVWHARQAIHQRYKAGSDQ